MPRRSRRALLATVAAGVVGVAGCTALPTDSPPTESPARRLRGKSIFVADAATLPFDDVTRVDEPTEADLAVFAATTEVEPVRSALSAGTVAAVVGTDAQLPFERACAADGRSYGLCRDSWNAGTNVAVAVPQRETLETQIFTDVSLPDGLPRTLGEAFAPAGDDRVRIESAAAVPSGVADALTPIGASRIRSRTTTGGFDRWDRVRVATGPDRAWLVLETTATIVASTESRFHADRIRLVDHFEHRLETVDAAASPADDVEIRTRNERSSDVAEHAFLPASDAARRSFAASQRAVVSAPTLPDPFTYTANGRFRWRDRRFIRDDDRWHHHTPGQGIWHPRVDGVPADDSP